MCLVIVCNHIGRLDPAILPSISDTLSRVIDDARVERRPVAYVQKRYGVGFDRLGVRIGRYEPIFGAFEAGESLPDGLIDFILKSSEAGIRLAGFAQRSQFQRFQTILSKAGIFADIDAAAISPTGRI
ncbi:MAG: hypothetical protein ABJH52_02660 [Henriciella sp.]